MASSEAAAPVSTKEANKERLERLKAAKAVKEAKGAAGEAVGPPGTAPKVKKERAPKAEKVVRACRCGCGGQTTAFFVPGHDARWKGWMKKIELGKMEPKDLPAGTQALYKFTKRGVGFVPTMNYNEATYIPQVAEEDLPEPVAPPVKTEKAKK